MNCTYTTCTVLHSSIIARKGMNLITARARDTQILLATTLGTCKGSVPARQPSWKGWSDATRALSQHLHLSSVHHLRFTMWWIGITHPIDRFYLLGSQHQTSRIWKPKSKTRSKTDPNDTKSCSSTHRWVTSNRIMNNKINDTTRTREWHKELRIKTLAFYCKQFWIKSHMCKLQ